MYLRPRHRHGAYALTQEHTLPRSLRLLLVAGAILVTTYLLWTLLLRILGVTAVVSRAGAFLTVEDRGTVSVTIDKKEQHAENGMMLFPGESVSTGPGAHASLQLFDGSRVRLNDGTRLTITQSERGTPSHITLNMEEGTIWILTAPQKNLTGSVLWSVTSPTLGFALAPGTEAMLSEKSVTVFSSDSEGISVSLKGHDAFLISEGQQWTMPKSGTVGDNVYDQRSPLDPLAAKPTFVLESRQIFAKLLGVRSPSGGPGAVGTDLLTVTSPLQDSVMQGPIVTVAGSVGQGVTKVMVNGYPAILDAAKGTFSQQVAPPDGAGPVDITVQALDAEKNVLAEIRRTVKRPPAKPLEAPTITVPAKAGETYNTPAEELILRGGAPKGAVGISVNDYKLQLFDPAKGEWSYVASLRLRNMVPGINTYDIVAVDAAGKKSPAARITIVQGAASEGVVTGGTSSAGAISSGPLPENAPLQPGSLTITSPEPGSSHTETGTGFLLEGLTSSKTATISVNDYTLQLYRAGKTTWNYIVDVGINNLKKGTNVYKIVARDKDQQILDSLTYTVEYTPATR